MGAFLSGGGDFIGIQQALDGDPDERLAFASDGIAAGRLLDLGHKRVGHEMDLAVCLRGSWTDAHRCAPRPDCGSLMVNLDIRQQVGPFVAGCPISRSSNL